MIIRTIWERRDDQHEHPSDEKRRLERESNARHLANCATCGKAYAVLDGPHCVKP